jgi:hypothetical protein
MPAPLVLHREFEATKVSVAQPQIRDAVYAGRAE